MSNRFFIQTLGCAKNTADSDGIGATLERAGFQAADAPEDADVVIVNTCGFLQASRHESLETLRALGQQKHDDQLLIAAGCLISRYGALVQQEAPGVDGVIDAGKWLAMPRLIQYLREQLKQPAPERDGSNWLDDAYLDLPREQLMARSVTDYLPRHAQGPSAYLKIADGCDRPCTFCIIPTIKGGHRSKPMDAALAEARELVALGAREIVLVAQDTTAYGWDWQQRDVLATLMERLCREVEGLQWLRLMYAYPGHITPRLIETMARYPQIVHYLDVPLQHAHPQVLQRMKRPNVAPTRRMLNDLRAAMPDLALRTTFIVGFPGETEEEFDALLEFIETEEFDRVGIFEFSREEGTPAGDMPHQVSRKVSARRRHEAMALQQKISLRKNRALVGATLQVLIEGVGEIVSDSQNAGAARRDPELDCGNCVSIGRSYRDAPEVDGVVIVQSELPIGRMVEVKITQASEYDLVGEPC
ncbi:30S ribosomal protein S12 methylthiotransferase RimO [Anaerolineae bacterium CFX7]|nr:30S ribosomal protein S12 methylthiotransferase RimO [Anaerolineae bacterium CFX7]